MMDGQVSEQGEEPGKRGWRKGHTLIVIKAVIAILLMVWVVYLALKMEATQAIGDGWSELSSSEQWEATWRIGPQKIIKTFTGVSKMWFLVSIICVAVTIVAGVLRLRHFLDNVDCHTEMVQLVSVTMVGYFFNSFLLGSTGGDVAKAYCIARQHPEKKVEAISAIFMDRLFGMFFMMAFALAALFPLLGLLSVPEEVRNLHAPILYFLVTVVIILVGGVGIVWRFAHVKSRIPEVIFRPSQKAWEAIRVTIKNPHLFGWASFWSLVINLFCILQIASLCLGLGVAFSPLILVFAVPVIITISAIPLTPSGFGIRENLYVLLLGLATPAIGPTEALAISLLAYAGTFFWNLTGGFFFLSLKSGDKKISREG